MNEIDQRLQLISDISAAFAGDNSHLNALRRARETYIGVDVHWEAQPDAMERLKKYQR